MTNEQKSNQPIHDNNASFNTGPDNAECTASKTVEVGVADDKAYSLTLGSYPTTVNVCGNSNVGMAAVPVTYLPANDTLMTGPDATLELDAKVTSSTAACAALPTTSKSAKTFNCTNMPVGTHKIVISTLDADKGERWRRLVVEKGGAMGGGRNDVLLLLAVAVGGAAFVGVAGRFPNSLTQPTSLPPHVLTPNNKTTRPPVNRAKQTATIKVNALNYWLKAAVAKPTAVVTGESSADFQVIVSYSSNLAAGNIKANTTKCSQATFDVALAQATYKCVGFGPGNHAVEFSNGNVNGCPVTDTVLLTVVAGSEFDQAPAAGGACKECSSCLKAAQKFVKDTVQAADSAAQVSTKFAAETWCAPTYGDAACLRLERKIAASKDGNLGRRPAAICYHLGACEPSRGCIGTAANETNANITISAPLDVCTGNGLVGGPRVGAPPYNASLVCRADSECTKMPHQVCTVPAANAQTSCECQEDGVDACFLLGTCSSFCSSQQPMMAVQNARVVNKACAKTSDCLTANEECVMTPEAKAMCFTLACANSTVTSTPCNATTGNGLCLPVSRAGAAGAAAAAFDPTRRWIVVSLSSDAKPGAFACADVFAANTTSKLGAGARCSVEAAAPKKLYVSLPTSATIVKTDAVMTPQSAGQTVLVDAMSGKAFNFSLNLGDCVDCKEPVAIMQAPTVSLKDLCCSVCVYVCVCAWMCVVFEYISTSPSFLRTQFFSHTPHLFSPPKNKHDNTNKTNTVQEHRLQQGRRHAPRL